MIIEMLANVNLGRDLQMLNKKGRIGVIVFVVLSKIHILSSNIMLFSQTAKETVCSLQSFLL